MTINQQNFNELETIYSDVYKNILYSQNKGIIYLYSKELSESFLKDNTGVELIYSSSIFEGKKQNIDNTLKECVEDSGNLGRVKSYVYDILKDYKRSFVPVMEERSKFLSLSNKVSEDDYSISCDSKNVKTYKEMVNRLDTFLSLHIYLKKSIESIIKQLPSDLIEDQRSFVLELKSIISIVKEPIAAIKKKYELIYNSFDKLIKRLIEEGNYDYGKEIYEVLTSVIKKEIEGKSRVLDNSNKQLPSLTSIKIKNTIFKNNNYISVLVKDCIDKVLVDKVEITLEQEKTAKIYLTTIYKKIKYLNLYDNKDSRKKRSTKEELIFSKGKFEEKLDFILNTIKELSKSKRTYSYFVGKYNNLKITYYFNEGIFKYTDNQNNEIDLSEDVRNDFYNDMVKCCSKNNNTYMKYEFMKIEPIKSLLPKKESTVSSIAKYVEVEEESEMKDGTNLSIVSKIKEDSTQIIEDSTQKIVDNFNF